MTRIPCAVTRTHKVNGEGIEVPAVAIQCSRCGHVSESFGHHGRAVRRSLALLNEECPRGEDNFYEGES